MHSLDLTELYLQHSEDRLANTLVIMYNKSACELESCDTFKWFVIEETKLITMENEADIYTINMSIVLKGEH